MSQPSSTMSLFVPRTVAAFERAATTVARRVATPMRSLASRAIPLADRVLGSWSAPAEATARPSLRTAAGGAYRPLPRPWYEADLEQAQAQEEAAQVAEVARAAHVVRAAQPTTIASALPPTTVTSALP